jgi:hypothetical protein
MGWRTWDNYERDARERCRALPWHERYSLRRRVALRVSTRRCGRLPMSAAPMKSPDEIARLRSKMIEHLEAALALADKTGDGTAGYLIESALDTIRADMGPGNLDLPRPPRQR